MSYSDFLDYFCDFFHTLGAIGADTCGNDVHVDLTCFWISGRLLHCGLNQAHSLLNVSFLNSIAESHLGNTLGDADQRLELARRRCDRLLVVAHGAHLLVLLHEYDYVFIGNLGEALHPGVRDVLRKEVTVDHVCENQVISLHFILCVSHAVLGRDGVKRHDVVGESAVRLLGLLVENQVD